MLMHQILLCFYTCFFYLHALAYIIMHLIFFGTDPLLDIFSAFYCTAVFFFVFGLYSDH